MDHGEELLYASVAQLVERPPRKRQVEGSNPPRGLNQGVQIPYTFFLFHFWICCSEYSFQMLKLLIRLS